MDVFMDQSVDMTPCPICSEHVSTKDIESHVNKCIHNQEELATMDFLKQEEQKKPPVAAIQPIQQVQQIQQVQKPIDLTDNKRQQQEKDIDEAIERSLQMPTEPNRIPVNSSLSIHLNTQSNNNNSIGRPNNNSHIVSFENCVIDISQQLDQLNTMYLMENTRAPTREWCVLMESVKSCLWQLCRSKEHEIQQFRSFMNKQSEEFSEIRVQLEHAQAMLNKEQQEQLNKVRAEELLKREEQVSEEIQRLAALAEQEKKKLEEEFEQRRLCLQQGSVPLLPGEKEALEGTKVRYFLLKPERVHTNSPESSHFRLAESQFYRLLESNMSQFKVTHVEYVINPQLVNQFRTTQATIEGDNKPILVFHGTAQQNINSICEKGFYDPSHPNFKMANGQIHGRGIYFSEFASMSLGYVQSGTKLLLCQILPGKTTMNSHNMWVIPSSKQVLPQYIVHYSNKPIQVQQLYNNAPLLINSSNSNNNQYGDDDDDSDY